MASKFKGAIPGGIWIVSLYQDDGSTDVSFPLNGTTYPNITFSDTDYNEPYLDAFDKAGLKVWLQVEPGAADVDALIQLVLQRYRHHSSVIGFGIDVEWFNAKTSPDGQKVSDTQAKEWEQHVKAVNPSYTLFLKHWKGEWMPPTYRGSILFVDDSQAFPSVKEMTSEFSDWANLFAFQFGYEPDSSWWREYPDPAKTIGEAILSTATNTKGLFWVDFTVTQVFPLIVTTGMGTTSAGMYSYSTQTTPEASLSKNFPWIVPEVTVVVLVLAAILLAVKMRLLKRKTKPFDCF
jgi:hypothetical protein